MPESTVELLKRAVDAHAKVLDKPQPDRRVLEEERDDAPKKTGGKS